MMGRRCETSRPIAEIRSLRRFLTSLLIGLTAIGVAACDDDVPSVSKAPLGPPKHNEAEDVRQYMNFTRPKSVVGELVYVPVYSSVYHHRPGNEYYLSATLSIHNIHLEGPMWLTAVNYYNTKGQRVREMVTEAILLRPLETKQFVIRQADNTGGTGANYIVKWEADRPMPSPKIEALMISTQSQQGISFLTHGSVVTRLTRTATSAAQGVR